MEPKVNVILGGATGKVNDWIEKAVKAGVVVGEANGLGLVVEKGKDPSTAIDVDGLEDPAGGVKQEVDGDVEEIEGAAGAADLAKDGMMSKFFVITVLMAAGHLLDAEGIPGRTDGTFKLWGSQSVRALLSFLLGTLIMKLIHASRQYGGYTDDSDLRLVVLHSGFITLEEMSAAKLGGRDLRVTLRVGRYPRGRYVGGPVEKKGAEAGSYLSRTRTSNVTAGAVPGGGVELRSYAWGNSHDGGSLEVVKCDWVKVGHVERFAKASERLATETTSRLILSRIISEEQRIHCTLRTGRPGWRNTPDSVPG